MVKDKYLDNIFDGIRHDRNIKLMAYESHPSKITTDILREQLCFFDKLNINLRNVTMMEGKKIVSGHPKNINIELDDNFFNAKTYFDEDNDMRCYYLMRIGNPNSYYPRISYISEITRTQMNISDNLCDNYNREVVPLFLELLFSDGIHYSNRLNDRLYELGLSISYMDVRDLRDEGRTYIYSFLQASNLYRLFNSANSEVKKEILGYLKMVFDGIITVEDFLNVYDINYDNSKVDLNILKRGK